MSNKNGFSLLEIIVVLVVLALLASATTGFMPSDGARLRAATYDLAAALRVLRASAMSLSIRTELTPLEKSYRMEPTGETRKLPSGVMIRLKDTSPNIVGITSDHVAFFSDGSSTGGTIIVQQRRRSISLTISSLTGLVEINEQ